MMLATCNNGIERQPRLLPAHATTRGCSYYLSFATNASIFDSDILDQESSIFTSCFDAELRFFSKYDLLKYVFG